MIQPTVRTLNAFVSIAEPVADFVADESQKLNRLHGVPLQGNVFRSAQLEKIKVCNSFTKAFTGIGFFDKSFPAYSNSGSNGLDRVTTVLMKQALTGSYPDIQLAHSKILVSKGQLPVAKYAAAAAMKSSKIYFNFTDDSGIGSAQSTDKIIVVAYAPELQEAVYSLNAGLRKNCEAVLEAKKFKGNIVETWIGFVSKDGSNASDSVYTGSIQL